MPYAPTYKNKIMKISQKIIVFCVVILIIAWVNSKRQAVSLSDNQLEAAALEKPKLSVREIEAQRFSFQANLTQAKQSENTISLKDCIRLAVKNSFEVRLARLDFLIAQTDRAKEQSVFDAVLSADINYEEDSREPLSVLAGTKSKTNTYSLQATKTLPTGTELTVSASDIRNWSDSAYASRNPAHTSEAGIEARQPIAKNMFGFIDRRNISITNLAIQNAGLDTQQRIEKAFCDIEKAYWQLLFNRKKLEVYQNILEDANRLYQTSSKNYDIGLIELGEFLAAEANVLIREKDLLLARNQYQMAQEKLKLLININTDQDIEAVEFDYQPFQAGLEECFKKAVEKRRDYAQAKTEVEIKQLTLETKKNAVWPEIDLIASLAANGVDKNFNGALREVTSGENRKYYAGIEVTVQLENNLARSQLEKADYDKQKALISLKQVERVIVTEVSDALRGYKTYQLNLDNLRQAAEIQLEKLQEEEKRFNSGRSGTKRLIDYQQDYLNSELQLAEGVFNFAVAGIDLEKALNISLDKYGAML